MNQGFWRDRRVLVTGATGLLGSWLVRTLVDLEAEVVCLIRDWVPRSELVRAGLLERVQVVRGDLCEPGLVGRTLAEYEIQHVFHLAAQTVVAVANRSPLSTFETNIAGTWTLLEACRLAGAVPQIVIASSDKAYGVLSELPYDENTPLRGGHPYDVSKSCADLIAQAYAQSYALPVTITRCGNLYGGGDLNWNRVVPGTIRSILRETAPIIRSDGHYVRDYFYVEDAALAYLRLAEQLNDDRSLAGEAFNLSYGRPQTVLDIVGTILQMMDSKLEPIILNEASNEIREQYLAADKARQVLSWKPQFDLEVGLERTIAWYREYFAAGQPNV